MLSQQTLEIVVPGGDEAEPTTPAVVVIDRAHGPSDALRADIAFSMQTAGAETNRAASVG